MKNNKPLCDDCEVLFSITSFDSVKDKEAVISEYIRLDQLPSLPFLTKAANSGCIFCTILLRRISLTVDSNTVGEIRLGPPTLVAESLWETNLSAQQEGIYTLKIPVDAGREISFSLWFDLFSEPSSDANTLLRIRRQPHHVNRASESCILQLQGWIAKCVDTHWQCEVDNEGFCPNRVVDVGPKDGSIHPKLVETNGSVVKYIALSHCWGPPTPETSILKTETSSLEAHMYEIPIYDMPPNFRDAVLMTRSLGLRYLWIDSLCIVQDSKEDWAREAAQMAKVYKCAWVTLAATSARTCQDGFLSYSPADQIFSIPFTATSRPSAENVKQEIVLQCTNKNSGSYWMDDVENSFWNSRGWTLQERHLSRRIIHFAESQIFWECRKGYQSESGQRILTLPLSVAGAYGPESVLDDEESSFGSDDSISNDDCQCQAPSLANTESDCSRESEEEAPGPVTSTLNEYVWWFSIVADYSRRQLTYSSDKLPAIAGFVDEMSKFVKDTRFLAGIWVSALADCLLWSTEDPSSTICVEPYRAPTWSWMRYDGPIIPTATTASEDYLREKIGSRDEITYVDRNFQREQTPDNGVSMAANTLEVRARIVKVSLTANSENYWNFDMHALSSSHTVGLIALDQEPKEASWNGIGIYAMQVKKQITNPYGSLSAASQTGLILKHVDREEHEFERIGVYVLNEENLDFFDSIEPRLVTLG